MIRLTYTRIRKQGEPDWFDPNTDVRKLVPNVMLHAIDIVETIFEKEKKEYKDALYIQNCIRIFQLRVIEDTGSVTSQLKEFMEAVSKVDKGVFWLWCRLFLSGMACVYALFCRRDSATDKDMLNAMLDTMRVDSLSDMLSESTLTAIRNDLRASYLKLKDRVVGGGSVVCNETGEYIDNVRDIACKAIADAGSMSWSDLSKACDYVFSTSGIISDTEAISVALAYPSYAYPTMTVVMEKNESSDKAEEPEKTGEPGDVQVVGGSAQDSG